jgi:hypothetical protein
MPEHIKALIIILFLSTMVVVFAKTPAYEIILMKDYRRRRNFWFTITLVAFLAHNIWIDMLIMGALGKPKITGPVMLLGFSVVD